MEIERNQDLIHLQQDQLLSLIQKAFPHCSHLQEWQVLKGGAINTLYKFKIGQEAFVLRLYTRDRAYCKIEKGLHALVEARVPTAKLIYSDESHESYAYAIFQFVNGFHLYNVHQDLKEVLSYELGKTLAAIHSFQFPQAGFFGDSLKIVKAFEPSSSPYFEETAAILSREGYVRDRLGAKFCDEILAFIWQYKDFFPQVKDNICLTHSDFKPVNLLYTLDGKVVVLDWEFAHAGIGILDFAILLRHRHQFPLSVEALKEGYIRHGGVLPDEWLDRQ